MAFGFGDFIKQTTTTAGTGTLTLIAPSGHFRAFTAASGTTVPYAISDGTDFEVGIGTVIPGSPDTLSRDTVLSSSNGGAKVNWSGNTKDVYIAAPAALLQSLLDWSGGTGIIARTVATAAGLTYAARAIAAGSGIAVADGDGVAGNPTVALDIDGLTAETAPAVGDEIAVYDLSATAARKITLANLFKIIAGLTAETAPAVGDEIAVYDLTAAAPRRFTLENLLKVIDGLTEDTAPAKATDFVATYDASAGAAKKMLLSRLTAPDFESSEQSLTLGSATNVAHGLGGIPARVEWILRNKTAEHNYAVADELIYGGTGPQSDATSRGIAVVADATNLTMLVGSADVPIVSNKSSGVNQSITLASWRVVLRAWT
jgi:hypothetical protein